MCAIEEFSIRRCTQKVLRHLSRLKTNSDILFHTMLIFLSYATTDVLLYGIYREFFPYYSPLRAKTHGWFLKKTFLGVLDAWILHNRDQNFIFPVILTRYIHDIANQLLTRHSPSTPLSQVDEWTAKPTPFSIQGRLLEFFQIMAAKPLKNPYCLEKVTFKLS